MARWLLLGCLAAPAFLMPRPDSAASPQSFATTPVYLATGIDDDGLVQLSADLGCTGDAIILLDASGCTWETRCFLWANGIQRVQPVGAPACSRSLLESRYEVRSNRCIRREAIRAAPADEAVVVCSTAPRAAWLQAACLAGTLHAPLLTPQQAAAINLSRTMCYAVGAAAQDLYCKRIHVLADADAVAAVHVELLTRTRPIETLVVANAADGVNGSTGTAVLAPLVALRRHAALVITNAAGDDVEARVAAATQSASLRSVENVILVADLQAIPMARRPNPLPKDKDPFIEMEPLTPQGFEPSSFAVGRLFHEERAIVPLLLARGSVLPTTGGTRRALVASNVGGSMSLLEAFSRNTALELRNVGYETTTRFGKEVNGDDLRQLLPENDVFLWEGHHNPLMNDFGFPYWDEPLPPTLVFLQSCLALKDYKAQPLLSRGAIGVVGSSTRTYSASGGACSLAFFNALLYDDASLGGALRQAKNFLLAYALLKEKRLGKGATHTGANLRAAWAFTLWGDPTLHLPRPVLPSETLLPVRHEVRGDTIVLTLPAQTLDKVTSAKYQSAMLPNARLAGLLRKEKDDETVSLVSFVFAEVRLPQGPSDCLPRLHSNLASGQYVFNWDARRNCGYLLVAPGTRVDRELRFRVSWQANDARAATAR